MFKNKNLFKGYTFADHEGISLENIPYTVIRNMVNQVPAYRDQVVYSYLFQEEKCFLGDNQCDCFGYKDKIFDVTNLIGLVHSEDLDEVYRLTKNAFDMIYNNSANIYTFKYNITYRIKNKKNQYRRILRETTPILADKKGKLICTLSRCTDISQLGHQNEIKAWITLTDRILPLSHHPQNLLSQREKEVLYYLSKGYSSRKISEQIFISKLTVDKHRANMLRKTGVQNTSELIKFAIEKGII